MDNLFLLLFFISIVALIVGFIKPGVFSRFLQKKATRKGTAVIFGISTVIFFVLFGITTESVTEIPPIAQKNKVFEDIKTDKQTAKTDDEQPKTQNQQEIASKNKTTKEPKAPEIEGKVALEETKTTPATQASTPTSVQAPKTNRESALVILKANASSKWGNDYQMVQYEYDNQVEAYDWVVAQTKYPDIMTKAKTKWGDDYQMVKYEYDNQVEAYEWIVAQTEYPDIMNSAKQKWSDNYQMVKYEYNNQVDAYKNL